MFAMEVILLLDHRIILMHSFEILCLSFVLCLGSVSGTCYAWLVRTWAQWDYSNLVWSDARNAAISRTYKTRTLQTSKTEQGRWQFHWKRNGKIPSGEDRAKANACYTQAHKHTERWKDVQKSVLMIGRSCFKCMCDGLWVLWRQCEKTEHIKLQSIYKLCVWQSFINAWTIYCLDEHVKHQCKHFKNMYTYAKNFVCHCCIARGDWTKQR